MSFPSAEWAKENTLVATGGVMGQVEYDIRQAVRSGRSASIKYYYHDQGILELIAKHLATLGYSCKVNIVQQVLVRDGQFVLLVDWS